MKTVAMPIENKAKEFDGKMWLGLNFVESGYEIILGPAWEIKSAIDIIEPDVYISKEPIDDNLEFFEALRNSGIVVCGLPTETLVNMDTSDYPQNKMQVLNAIDAYFEWGQEPANELRRVYQGQGEKIKITGNPRFDLLTAEKKCIYTENKNRIRNEYGDFILFNTNFSIGNPIDRASMIESIEKNQLSVDILEQEHLHSRIMYAFIELILYLISVDIDYNIVLRPHPDENPSIYRTALEQYDDIYVRHKGDVRPWIYASKGVVHYDSTTGIEAAIMKTPVLSYQPFSDEISTTYLSQIVSDRATTREDVRAWINDTVSAEPEHVLDDQQKTELVRFFPNIDQLAAPQIVDTVDSLVNNSEGFSGYSISSQNRIERWIKSSTIRNKLLDLYNTTRYVLLGGQNRKPRTKQRQKFSGLTRNEVIKKGDMISQKIYIRELSVESVPQTNHSYAVREKT